ncbi:MAG: hypothetical protein ACFE8L_11605 [Candidatus Hodarchaeota archaeon]
MFSKIQEADKTMRGLAIVGGIVGVIEAILNLAGFGLFRWGLLGIAGSIIGLIIAIIAIFLGFRPIHYTPAILGVIGVFLIIFGMLIGGIIVLLAAFVGALS